MQHHHFGHNVILFKPAESAMEFAQTVSPPTNHTDNSQHSSHKVTEFRSPNINAQNSRLEHSQLDCQGITGRDAKDNELLHQGAVIIDGKETIITDDMIVEACAKLEEDWVMQSFYRKLRRQMADSKNHGNICKP